MIPESFKSALAWLMAYLVVLSGLLVAMGAIVVAIVAALSPIPIPFLIVVWLIKVIVT